MKKPSATKINAKPAPKSKPAPLTLTKADDFSGARATLVRIGEIDRRLRAVTEQGTYRATKESLAAELEVSVSTIKRDLFILEHLFNAPICNDPRRRTKHYDYRRKFVLRPPLFLAPRPVLALLVAIRLASHARTFPLGGDLVEALTEIGPVVAGGAAFGPETLDPVFSINTATAGAAEAGHFALLCEAIAHRREVRIIYRKAKTNAPDETRTVQPLHWFLRHDACQLLAHDPAIGQRRNFELIRIQHAEFTGASFEWPPGFDLKKYLSGGFGRFIGEPAIEVRVRLDRDYVPLFRERPWQGNETLVMRPDGCAEVTYHICHAGDLEQYVLRAGGQAEIVYPPDVRERIHASAARILARHAPQSSSEATATTRE